MVLYSLFSISDQDSFLNRLSAALAVLEVVGGRLTSEAWSLVEKVFVFDKALVVLNYREEHAHFIPTGSFFHGTPGASKSRLNGLAHRANPEGEFIELYLLLR
jgi:hypothetical protein